MVGPQHGSAKRIPAFPVGFLPLGFGIGAEALASRLYGVRLRAPCELIAGSTNDHHLRTSWSRECSDLARLRKGKAARMTRM